MIRFITDSARSAVFNMAADQFLLEKCTCSDTVFVRFYFWEKPSITLGYMQKADEILDFNRITSDNVSWIKRPTGGRAVLHDEDLTYSCIFPTNLHIMGATVQQSYAIITGCLISGLKLLGIPCQAHDSYKEYLNVKREVKLPCFLAPNRDEIMVDGKKLVGSAQRRTVKGVLQHGSIPLSNNYRKLPLYLKVSDKERERHQELLLAKSISIHEINPDITADNLTDALRRGFLRNLNLDCEYTNWTAPELREIYHNA
jgi:Lipoate-protein ligase A